MTRPLAGEVLGEGYYATFAGVIPDRLHGFRRSAAQARDRGDVDDLASSSLRDHHFARRLGAQERSRKVGFEYFVPVLDRHLLDGSAPGNAGVVDENIDSAQLSDGCVHGLQHARSLFYIATERDRADAKSLEFVRSLLTTLFLTCCQRNARAHFRQTFRHLPAQADRAACDQRNATAKVKQLFHAARGRR